MTSKEAVTLLAQLVENLYKNGEVKVTPELCNQLNTACTVIHEVVTPSVKQED